MEELFVRRTLIGFTLKIIGLVVIGWGIIQAFILLISFSQPFPNEMGMTDGLGGIGFLGFLTIVATNAVYGILIIGFGEVIDLLQKIHDQNDPGSQELPTIASIPLFIEREINEFYSKNSMKIDSISPTKSFNIFIVKAEGLTECIQLGGLTPQILTDEEAAKYFE